MYQNYFLFLLALKIFSTSWILFLSKKKKAKTLLDWTESLADPGLGGVTKYASFL